MFVSVLYRKINTFIQKTIWGSFMLFTAKDRFLVLLGHKAYEYF